MKFLVFALVLAACAAQAVAEDKHVYGLYLPELREGE